MHVQVEDRLSRARSNIKDGAVSVLDVALAGDLGSSKVAAAYHFGVGCLRLFQSSKMLFRNDEHVRGCLRPNVFERKDVFVFVNFFGGYLAADHTAE